MLTKDNNSRNIRFEDAATPPERVRCHIAITPEEDGGFSVVVLNLPGAGSCGATQEEAISNVRDAVAGAVELYRELGMDIPWLDLAEYDLEEYGTLSEATLRWILVNV